MLVHSSVNRRFDEYFKNNQKDTTLLNPIISNPLFLHSKPAKRLLERWPVVDERNPKLFKHVQSTVTRMDHRDFLYIVYL